MVCSRHGVWAREMRVCDLFAGLGGFTCGALEAGADVVLAVDSDPVPLKLLGANAPRAKTVVATLGRDSVELPPAAPDLHVHMSTPCTTLSMARRGKATTADSDNGLPMIRWAVELVLQRGDHSWSLENVATRATRALFSELEAAHPERVAWAVFDSADFGAPQSRVRLIRRTQKADSNAPRDALLAKGLDPRCVCRAGRGAARKLLQEPDAQSRRRPDHEVG